MYHGALSFPGGVSESVREKMSGRLKLTECCVSDFLLRIRAVLLLSVNLLHIIKTSCSGEGNGNPLQYSCLEKSMDRGVWRAEVHGIT